MKRSSLLLSLCAALCLSAAGCGTGEPDVDPPAGEQSAGDQSGVGDAEQPGAGDSQDGPVEQMGKVCYAACTVQKIDPAAMCPATINGYGNTTFLGGCNKACSKAQGDAAAKLPPGCVISTCSFSGC